MVDCCSSGRKGIQPSNGIHLARTYTMSVGIDEQPRTPTAVPK